MRILIVFAMLTCTGCASMNKAEMTWQTAHAIDVLQTINHGSDPCYREAVPMTRALIGEHPNAGETIAWGVASSIVHYAVTRTLEKTEAPKWMQNTWQATTIGLKVHTVANNHSIGVRPWGDNKSHAGCSR